MATAGPNFPDSVVNDSTIAGMSWTEPSRVTVDDSVAATAAALSSQIDTNYLKATDFDFAIPTGATINGIQVEWDRSAPTSVVDKAVRIVKGGVIGSTDKSAGAWSPTDGYKSYGGAADLWGETWTVSDINSTGFGCAISATLPAFIAANVDAVRVTITYTEEDESSSSSSQSSSSSSSVSSSSSSSSSLSSSSSSSSQSALAQDPGDGTYFGRQQRCKPRRVHQGHFTGRESITWTGIEDFKGGRGPLVASLAATTEDKVEIAKFVSFSDFGFALPIDAVVSGVEVDVETKVAGASVKPKLRSLLIVKGDVPSLDSFSSSDLTTDYTFKKMGGTKKLWGVIGGLTPEVVNSPDFGCAVNTSIAALAGETVVVSIRTVCITVYFYSTQRLT